MTGEDKDILSILQRNSEKGFRLLMGKYQEPIYWHIRRLVVSHDDAQDATQETFVRVFRNLGQVKKKDSFAAWIYRIATNEAFRILDARKAETMDLDASQENIKSLMADEYVDYSDLETVRLQEAILSLPPKQQLPFNLRYYDELGYEDIAGIIGATAASAKANYHIAKEKIIEYMNNHSE